VVAGYEAASYYALFAPAATPRPVQDKINAGVAEALRQPAIFKRLETNGMQSLFAATEQSQVFVQREAQKWGDLIRTAGIKLK
jgi:tripartite-type tricarboxylate transporter receptor subunit TctC